jgi:LPS sulfotransferase NodH
MAWWRWAKAPKTVTGERRLAEVLAGVVPQSPLAAEVSEALAARGAATVRWCLFFTPRAGSTWLVDLVSRQEMLGQPREYLNHNLAPRIAAELGATSLESYLDRLAVVRASPGGVFGMKATYFQIRHAERDLPFERLFPPPQRCLYIRRENLVAQGISLWKAVTSRIPHRHAARVAEDGDRLAAFEQGLAYDAAAIRYWMEHVLVQEEGFEALFAERRLQPVRLVYEEVMAGEPLAVLDLVHRTVLDTPYPVRQFQPGRIERIGTDTNAAFEARFRAEEGKWLASVAERRPTLT